MYPQDVLDEIRHQARIEDIIGDYVSLIKAGKNYKALCPFHDEKTPSFTVSPEKQMYHCFGCKAGGNVFKFVMEIEHITFPEAVRLIAGKAGIDLSRYTASEMSETAQRRERIYTLNEKVLAYYEWTLHQSPEGLIARNYLSDRGLTLDSLRTFRLGYARSGWNCLTDKLQQEKYSRASILEAALASTGKNNNAFFDIFRDRIIFPIIDHYNRVIGFGGRILHNEKDSVKYLNTAETAVFHKGSILYGIHAAYKEIKKTNTALICEGYFDVIMLHQHGFCNAVAPMGTALTPNQVKLLKRYCSHIVCVFDSDAAGEKAAQASIGVCFENGMGISVLQLPEGTDPDEFCKTHGTASFKELLATAASPIHWLLTYFTRTMPLISAAQKVSVTHELFSFIMLVQNAIEVSEYLKEVSLFLHIKEEALLNEYTRYVKSRNNRHSAGYKPEVPINSTVDVVESKIERMLIEILCIRPEYLKIIVAHHQPSDFKDAEVRRVFSVLLELYESQVPLTYESILEMINTSPITQSIREKIIRGVYQDNTDQIFQETYRAFYMERLMTRIEYKESALYAAQQARQESVIEQYLSELSALKNERLRLIQEKPMLLQL